MIEIIKNNLSYIKHYKLIDVVERKVTEKGRDKVSEDMGPQN